MNFFLNKVTAAQKRSNSEFDLAANSFEIDDLVVD